MKISPINMAGITNRYSTVKKPPAAAEISPKSDKVDFSENGKTFASALKAVKQIPEVREDRIAELKQRIESGSYNTSSDDIARKIIQSLIL